MKKIIPIIVLLILTAFIFVSCKSTPAPTELTQQKIPEALIAPMNKADAARKRAVDFECPAYFPSDWETAEAQYRTARGLPISNNEEVRLAAEAYNSSAQAYDDIFMKTVPLYAQAREDEILAAREKLINTGFTEYFPDYLEDADNMTLAALEQYEADEYYKAKETAAKALKEYETLLLGADVYLARQEIIDRGFLKYDEDNFKKADEVTQAAIKEYEDGNKETAVESAQEALLRYNLILSNAWSAYSAELKVTAGKERELAIAERAHIASRELFHEADINYNQAENNLEKKNYREAALQYIDADAMFSIARKDTAEKRQKAETTIKRAEEKIAESGESGSEAERIIEGGSR